MHEIYMAGPSITEHEINVVEDAMRNGWYGDKAYYYCELLQKEFAAYHNRKHAILTPNCTTAIHLTLMALEVGPGDEVIVPECTWIATAAPVTWCGATPIFADIDPESWCIDPKSVKDVITEKTKAIIAVNLYGNMAPWDKLLQLSSDYQIPIIEDAAESLGSMYCDVRSGKFGVASVFSFHRTKTMTTGEGGILLTDDDALCERAMFLRDHGRHPTKAYFNTEVAYKYMPSNLMAALGYAQFTRLSELIKIKRHHLETYKERLGDLPVIFNFEPPYVFNGCWITTMVHANLDKKLLIEVAAREEVPLRPFFYPLSSLPAYKQVNKYRDRNPVAYDISSRGVNLPGAMTLTNEQLDTVCTKLRGLLK